MEWKPDGYIPGVIPRNHSAPARAPENRWRTESEAETSKEPILAEFDTWAAARVLSGESRRLQRFKKRMIRSQNLEANAPSRARSRAKPKKVRLFDLLQTLVNLQDVESGEPPPVVKAATAVRMLHRAVPRRRIKKGKAKK